MRFKAILTTDGVILLEQRFLPAFERIGKLCHLYLTPSDLFLMHHMLSADGVQAIAQFPTAELFSEHLISSASADRIAFSLDLSLLARALRSSLATGAARHLLKLVKKSSSPNAPALPFLSLEAKGERSSIVQDIPISSPLPRSQLNELQAGIDLVHTLPETLVQLPDLPSLRQLMERLQSVGDVADVATMRCGALAMRTQTPSISIAAQFRNLRVFGANAESQQSGADPGAGSRQGGGSEEEAEADISGLSTRLRQMQATGDATVVSVSLKHLARSLQCYLTRPDASYCGVAPNEACLLMIFQYANSPISLQYRLPLLDPG
ncbi:hypothetical protein CLOM_g20903 [Closterium sp. NIES-68]|nr:hypothetical protein CLOM_g20903 [Closterium sp. NIES-68]GJP80147.1 hypothetical protein CLOP_g10373 [Closterium sp. NIES-67]